MASRSKILNQFSVDEVILWLNAHNMGDELFVCWACGDLMRGDPKYLCTTTSGDERSFCADCTNYCHVCEHEHAPSLAYMHEDCKEEKE